MSSEREAGAPRYPRNEKLEFPDILDLKARRFAWSKAAGAARAKHGE
jgi:hypothetical protein